MINLEEFKTQLKDRLSSIGETVSFKTSSTVNRCSSEDLFVRNVSLNVNSLYELYLSSNIEAVMSEIFLVLSKAAQPDTIISEEVIMEKLKNFDSVYLELINKVDNEELLKKIPYRDYIDMAIIFRIRLTKEASIIINNELMKKAGITNARLFAYAYTNTYRDYKFELTSLYEKMKALNGIKSLSDEEQNFSNTYLHVLCSKEFSKSACGIIYPDWLSELAEKYNDNIYIIPSSIHEVLLVPSDNDNEDILENLSEMVMQVNSTEVEPKERLSNQIYKYDRKVKDVYKVTSNPESVLDY